MDREGGGQAREEPEFRALAFECAARDTQPFWGRCRALTGYVLCAPEEGAVGGVLQCVATVLPLCFVVQPEKGAFLCFKNGMVS